MNTNDIEKELQRLAGELKNGDQMQEAYGQQVLALAHKIEEYRKASQTPLNADNIKGIESGGSVPPNTPTRKWGAPRKWRSP